MSTTRETRPHLIRQTIVDMLTPLDTLGSDPAMIREMISADAADMADLLATLYTAQSAQTVLFSTDQALALKPALERFSEGLREYRLPFEYTILQFTEPIGESQLLPYPEDADGLPQPLPGEDRIMALVMAQTEDEEGKLVNSVSAWFQSTAVNRVSWFQDDKAHLRMLPFARPGTQDKTANKQTLRNLAIACIAYINCENITLERKPADEKLNRSRTSKGKKPFDDYYLCKLRTAKGEPMPAAGQGSGHGFRYDVRGHFRRLPEGKLTWVRAHQRGIEHELYKPKVYGVD